MSSATASVPAASVPAAAFAVFGWQYNRMLLVECVLVSLGVSLVVRGLAPGKMGAH